MTFAEPVDRVGVSDILSPCTLELGAGNGSAPPTINSIAGRVRRQQLLCLTNQQNQVVCLSVCSYLRYGFYELHQKSFPLSVRPSIRHRSRTYSLFDANLEQSNRKNSMSSTTKTFSFEHKNLLYGVTFFV